MPNNKKVALMVMLSRVTWRENRSQPSYIKLTKSTQLVTRRSYLPADACMHATCICLLRRSRGLGNLAVYNSSNYLYARAIRRNRAGC